MAEMCHVTKIICPSLFFCPFPNFTCYKTTSKMMVFLVLLLCYLSYSKDACKGVNAQVNCEFTDYDQNEYVVFATKGGSTMLTFQRYRTYDHNTWKVKSKGTKIEKMDLEYSSMNTVLRDTVADRGGINAFNLDYDASVIHLSNLQDIYVHVDFQNPYIENHGVVTVGVEDFSGFRGVHFAMIGQNKLKLDFGRNNDFKDYIPGFEYRYPVNPPWPVFDRDGVARGVEANESKAATRVIDSDTMPFQTSSIMYDKQPENGAEFVTMIYTQQSLKIIQYRFQFTMQDKYHRNYPEYMAKPFLVVPKIVNSKYDPDEQFSSFMSFETGGKTKDNSLYLIVGLNIDQARGFDTFHKLVGVDSAVYQMQNKSGPYPFLVHVDIGKGNELTLTRAVMVLKDIDSSKWPDEAYGTGLSIRDGKIIMTSSPYLFKTQKGTIKATDNNLDGFISLYEVNGNTYNLYTSEKLKDVVKYSKENLAQIRDKKKLTFYPAKASWTVDGGTSKFVVGGMIFAFDDPYNKKARIYVMDITDPKNIKIDKEVVLGFSDRDSNMLNDITIVPFTDNIRKKDDDDYRMFLNMYIDGPSDNSKDDVAYQADIWRVDCSTPNEGLELFAKILFFVFFGIAVFMFSFATIIFSIKGFYSCNCCHIQSLFKKKKKEKDEKEKDEKKGLLDEEEDGEKTTVINDDDKDNVL